MNNFWLQAPFARLLIPLIAGVLYPIFTGDSGSWSQIAVPATLLLLLLLVWAGRKSLHKNWIHAQAFVVFMLFASGGVLLHYQYHELNNPNHFSYHPSAYKMMRICEAPVIKEKSVKLVLAVTAVNNKGNWQPVIGKLQIYAEKDSLSLTLKYGDVLLARLREQEVPPPMNPGEFNYKRYLLFNNIFHRASLHSGEYRLLAHHCGNPVYAFAYGIRDQLIDLFKQYVPGKKEAAVSTALVFGYADELDPDLIQSYSNTGTLHVLAVSGMHVGIIFAVLNWMLGFMDKNRKTVFLKAVIITLFLWSYSLVAGLSPSILRAATMFTFITVGKMAGRRSNIYNTLAASAFLMMLFKPTIIASVGFQLSYAALIGIVFLQPRLYRLLAFRSYAADNIWKITAVSIAAQATTFPLGLLYFHQFPNYFIFSNLIIIPLTTIILYIGIVLICLSWQPVVSMYIGKVIAWSIALTNWLVEQMDALPGSTINAISISIPETILIYLLMGFMCAFGILGAAWRLRAALVCAILMAGFNLAEQYGNLTRQSITIYHVPGHAAVDLVQGNSGLFITDTALLHDSSALRFHIMHHWWQLDAEMQGKTTAPALLQAGHKNLLWINGKKQLPAQLPATVQFVLLSNNPWIDMGALKQKFNPELVIFDASNKPRKVGFLKKEAARLGLAVYDIRESGAFEYED